MVKDPNYILKCTDSETGYGLLYSQKHDRCIFLNTVAACLWKIPSDSIDPHRDSRLFADVLKIPGAEEYVLKVISDMHRNGLLHPLGEPCATPSNEKREGDYKLEQIYFYVTKECNARCYHCYQPTISVGSEPSKGVRGQISKEVFLEFARSALPLGLKSVKLSGGEPLLREDIWEIIKGIKDLGIHISMETNGSLIDEKAADMLSELGVGVTISLDGGSAEVHDSLRRLPGSFDKAVKALKMLSERGCEPQAIISISHLNLGEVENVVRVAATNGCRLIKLNPVNTLGLAKKLRESNLLLSPEEIMGLYKSRSRLESKYNVFIFVEGPPSFASIYEICTGHSAMCPSTSILGVLHDGSISFCGVGNSCPELIFGRIGDENFDIQRLWKDAEILIQLRNRSSLKLKGICEICIFESFCKGSCPALAYGEYKSLSAPDPWCQSAFENGIFPNYYLKT